MPQDTQQFAKSLGGEYAPAVYQILESNQSWESVNIIPSDLEVGEVMGKLMEGRDVLSTS